MFRSRQVFAGFIFVSVQTANEAWWVTEEGHSSAGGTRAVEVCISMYEALLYEVVRM